VTQQIFLQGAVSDYKPTFYEQVTVVNIRFEFFIHSALVWLLSQVAPHVALHRVSIRTLDELSCCKLGAGWGSRGESMLPFVFRP
jgi:hypothetical protein